MNKDIESDIIHINYCSFSQISSIFPMSHICIIQVSEINLILFYGDFKERYNLIR
jgi:hypothetical protein